MANTIFQLRRNTVSGTRPTTSKVSPGELAINTADGILFSANATVVFEVGSNNTTIAIGNSTFRSTINSSSFSIANTVAVTANGSTGTAGQLLTSNGTGVYWSSAGVNTAAQYSWTNTHIFSANLLVNNATLSVGNSTVNTSANGTAISIGANTLTIGTGTFFVANGNVGIGNSAPVYKLRVQGDISLSGGIQANGSFGSAGQILISNGTVSSWNSGVNLGVREQFTAANNQTVFTVSGGYTPNSLDVYYNGVKLRNGTEVNTSSGTTFVLVTGAANNALLEAVGAGPFIAISNTAQPLYQQFTATANQTTFTVSSGYIPSTVDVFADGIKLVNGTDVNISSGSNIVLSSGVLANTRVEVRGFYTPLLSTQSTTAVRQTFTANSTVNNSFTVTGGYIAGQVDVYYNGSKLVNGPDVNTSSGSNIVLTSNAALGAIIDCVGINYYTAGGGVTAPVRQGFIATANQTTFTVTGGYTPGQIDVYRNGVKLAANGNINTSSGTSVVLATGAANGDVVEVVGVVAANIGDSVRRTGDTMTGSLNITGTLAVTGAITSNSANVITTQTPGTIIQTVYARTDARTTYSSLPTGDGTTITDLNITITPRSATNRLIIQWMINGELHQDNVFLIHRGGVLITTAGEEGRNSVSNSRYVGYASAFYDQNEDSTPSNWMIQYSQIAGSTASRTYAPAVRSSASGTYTLALNRTIGSTGADLFENMVSSCVIYEVVV